MPPKYVSDKLLTSTHLRNSKADSETPPEKADNPDSEGAQEIETIVQREHHAIRGKAEERNIREVARRRHEVEGKLREFIEDLEQGQKSIRQEMKFCRELLAKLDDVPEDINPENLGELRRLVREADLELLKKQRDDVMSAESAAGGAQAAPLTEIDFLHLTRIGLGLTWPLMAAMLLAAVIVGAVLLALFKV